MTAQMVFRVPNKHAPGAGPPPEVDGGEDGKYFGYFENEYGEQFVFVYERASGEATLYVGDDDWSAVRVIDGQAEGVVLNEAEQHWVSVCWSVAVG